MKRWVRIALYTVGALGVLLGAAYYWFVVESHVQGGAHFALDIAEVRRLAGTAAGDKPVAIEVESVGVFKPPAAFVVAGDGWKPSDLPVYSYRVVYPRTSAIIDTALNQDLAKGSLDSYDAAAFARIQVAMAQSSLILVTHEHSDHIGGLTNHPNLKAVMAAARLTRDQLANSSGMQPAKFPDHALDGYVPLAYEKYAAVAPGMVVIKSPGHTPGSQMVYVQTSDGKEFLFIGDVAWHFRNIEVQRERPRFATQFMMQEDRAAVFGELAALKRLHEAEPGIQIVPGHDGAAVGQLINVGLLKSGFAAPVSDEKANDLQGPRAMSTGEPVGHRAERHPLHSRRRPDAAGDRRAFSCGEISL